MGRRRGASKEGGWGGNDGWGTSDTGGWGNTGGTWADAGGGWGTATSGLLADRALTAKGGEPCEKNKGGEWKKQRSHNLLLFPSVTLRTFLPLRRFPLTFSSLATLGTPSTGAISPEPNNIQSTNLTLHREDPLSSPEQSLELTLPSP
ncbi:unnamed protein product [Closterium sp. NIES-54]